MRLAFLTLMLLCVTFVSSEFIVSVEPLNDTISPGQTAVYGVTTLNNGETAEDLRFEFSNDPSWSVITNPIFHQASFKVAPDEEKYTLVYLTPDESVDSGQKYQYTIAVVSNSNDVRRYVDLDLFYRSPGRPLGYVPIVEIDVDVNYEIDPRDPGQLVISLRNFNPLNISELQLVIESTVNPANDRTETISLNPLESKIVEFPISYDPLQPPVTDELSVTAVVPSYNKTFEPRVKTVSIKAYSEIEKDTVDKEEFLKGQVTHVYKNNGNVDAYEQLRVKTSVFGQIFTAADPKARVEKEGGFRYLVWDMQIEPQGTRSITVIKNYRPLFIAFVLAVVILILYFVFRSPVVIKKEAVRLTDDIKILLHVKNRSGRVVEHLTVMDKIPRIAVMSTDFPVGTMQPSKVIKHEKKGTVVKWNVPALEAYEERIITYKLGSKLKIVGSLRLPAAMVKYKNKMNRFSKVYSARVNTY